MTPLLVAAIASLVLGLCAWRRSRRRSRSRLFDINQSADRSLPDGAALPFFATAATDPGLARLFEEYSRPHPAEEPGVSLIYFTWREDADLRYSFRDLHTGHYYDFGTKRWSAVPAVPRAGMVRDVRPAPAGLSLYVGKVGSTSGFAGEYLVTIREFCANGTTPIVAALLYRFDGDHAGPAPPRTAVLDLPLAVEEGLPDPATGGGAPRVRSRRIELE